MGEQSRDVHDPNLPFHRIAARWWILLNVKSRVWAAHGDRMRSLADKRYIYRQGRKLRFL
jgi:hypothetical protein